MLPKVIPIISIVAENPTVKTFVLDDAIPDARPGQFLMVWLPGVEEKPLSIVQPDPLTLTVARVGPFSTALHDRRPGDLLGWRGPFGNGFTLPDGGPILLVGGGYGAASLHFLAQVARQRDMFTTVLLGARRTRDLVLAKRFAALGCRVELATEDGSQGYHGLATDAAIPLMDGVTALYACGPELMLHKIAVLCRERSLPAQLSLERHMKCGFGLCGQCALDGRLVCLDGPVFEAAEALALKDFGRCRRSATGRKMAL